MKDYQSLSHTKWDCKYHVVFIPKYRRKRIFGVIRPSGGRSRLISPRGNARNRNLIRSGAGRAAGNTWSSPWRVATR